MECVYYGATYDEVLDGKAHVKCVEVCVRESVEKG